MKVCALERGASLGSVVKPYIIRIMSRENRVQSPLQSKKRQVSLLHIGTQQRRTRLQKSKGTSNVMRVEGWAVYCKCDVDMNSFGVTSRTGDTLTQNL